MDAKGWQVNRNQKPNGLHAMVTAQHLKVVEQYLADLKECVAIVKANPELANQGGAATYGMMAHIPMRGMVKKKVLEIYSNLYKAGGGEMDLAAQADQETGEEVKQGLVDRVLAWYVKRQTQKATK